MKTALFLLLLAPAFGYAKTQTIECYGSYQQATLTISEKRTSLLINDEGDKHASTIVSQVDNSDGTTTFNAGIAGVAVIPTEWIDKSFDRLSKYDEKGFQITEMTSFIYNIDQSIIVSECESKIKN